MQQSFSAKKPQMSDQQAHDYLKRGHNHFNQGQIQEAMNCAKLVLKYRSDMPQAHFLIGLIALEQSNFIMAEKAFRTTTHFDPSFVAAYAQLARVFVILGQYSNAQIALEQVEKLGTSDPLVMDVAATAWSLLGDQEKAVKGYSAALECCDLPMVRLNRAKTLMFTGDFKQAGQDLEKVLAVEPRAGMPHWIKARLSKAKDDSHIHQMLDYVQSKPQDKYQAPYFWYAIGKEYEDLEQWEQAIDAYHRGAAAQRSLIPYDEQVEVDLFKACEDIFTKDWLVPHNNNEASDGTPIFIIGQPRTGTTLVERILAAHSQVHAAGELQQMRLAIRSLAGVNSPHVMDADVMKAISKTDMQKLGEAYLHTVRAVKGSLPYFIDKMPVNYLYAPLIAAALPQAKIIHLVRGAADSCVSSYKQLFADAYPHSYDQGEMARHHCRYRHLMDQYRETLGDRMLDVHYETVVNDVEANTHKILDFVGLSFEQACLSFHKSTEAVTTASAAQVREKAHTRSIGRYKKFEPHISEMLSILQQSGYD